jgi:predicted dehydrogenase
MIHIHVSSTETTKTRRCSLFAENGVAVFDDGEPRDKLKLYQAHATGRGRRARQPLIPTLRDEPPLRLQCQHFVDSLLNGSPHRSDQEHGRRVIEILHAAEASQRAGGAPVYLAEESR